MSEILHLNQSVPSKVIANENTKINLQNSQQTVQVEVRKTCKMKLETEINKVVENLNEVESLWYRSNEKLYDGLIGIYGIAKEASDKEISEICEKYDIDYKNKKNETPEEKNIEIIFLATFDRAFSAALDDDRYKNSFKDRRKIYKMAIKKMLDKNFTKEQALDELNNKGVEAVARGKGKEKTLSNADNTQKDIVSYELKKEQKTILDTITDQQEGGNLKPNFLILRYDAGNVFKVNSKDVIKSFIDTVDEERLEAFIEIVSDNKNQRVGNPPISNNDAVDGKEFTNEEK